MMRQFRLCRACHTWAESHDVGSARGRSLETGKDLLHQRQNRNYLTINPALYIGVITLGPRSKMLGIPFFQNTSALNNFSLVNPVKP
jgi:hypothetical protein